MQDIPTLHTPRLVLRPLQPQDAPLIFALRSDPRVVQHTGIPVYVSIEEAAAYIGRVAPAADCRIWAASLTQTDEKIGTACLWNFAPDGKSAEIGYDLLPAFWGRGLAPEMIRAVAGYAFSEMGFSAITADLAAANARSARALQKAGFTFLRKYTDEGGAAMLAYRLAADSFLY